MPAAYLMLRNSCTWLLHPWHLRGPAILMLAALAGFSAAASGQSCPALPPYYPEHSPAPPAEWAVKLPVLEALLESCLRNAEYFALLGAAQLNTGQVAQALESLERALLIDPHNGAAQIDYAEGLFVSGQLFAAIEINTALLTRQDLPANLQPLLLARQRLWRQQTRHHQFMVEATTGFDDNLNGAPTRSDLTLTFGGTPVTLALSPDYRPIQGGFANVRLGGAWQWQTPDNQHDLLATARVRKTSVGDTDLAQGDWRYTFSLPARHHQWEFSAGTSHMLFGGSPLYSVGDLRARLVLGGNLCKPSLEGGAQQLHYHSQSLMDGLETSVTAGFGCAFAASQQGVRVEAGLLSNKARSAERPGGDRSGWNVRLNWQVQLGANEFTTQLGYASLDDQRGYSVLLANNATRQVQSGYLNLHYKRMLKSGLSLLLNLSHQKQRSNLEPFQNRGTVAEVGLAINF